MKTLLILTTVILFPSIVYPDTCTVEKVLSGDSIVCSIENKPTEIRLLGVQSPENSDSKEHCFAHKSTKCLEDLVLNKEVRLDYDGDEKRFDKSNSLLAWIFIGEENINLVLIKNGCSHVYNVIPYNKYPVLDLIDLNLTAAEEKAGFWGGCGK